MYGKMLEFKHIQGWQTYGGQIACAFRPLLTDKTV